jgi:hypothetical protein
MLKYELNSHGLVKVRRKTFLKIKTTESWRTKETKSEWFKLVVNLPWPPPQGLIIIHSASNIFQKAMNVAEIQRITLSLQGNQPGVACKTIKNPPVNKRPTKA